jgi:hypothetical protein
VGAVVPGVDQRAADQHGERSGGLPAGLSRGFSACPCPPRGDLVTFPSSASVVVVKGYWWADDGTGVTRQVTATPSVDHVTSASGRGVIDLVEKTATPDGDNPYWELELVASNDPDLIPQFAWTFRMSGYDGAWTVTVPHDADPDSDDRPSVWLTELDPLVEIPEPQTSDYYYTKNQVDQKCTDHIGLSTPGWDPHPQYALDADLTPIVLLTAAAYTALTTKDPNTLYVVIG